MTRNRSVALRCALVALSLVMASVSGCAQGSSATPDQEAARDTVEQNGVTEEALVYAAALDSLVTERSALWGDAKPNAVRVLSTIHWWPMVQLDGSQSAALGPVPMALSDMAKRRGYQVTVVSFGEAIADDGTVRPGGPVITFGPIDYLDRGQALLRMSIYAGRNGQELYRITLRRTGGKWHTAAVQIELQS